MACKKKKKKFQCLKIIFSGRFCRQTIIVGKYLNAEINSLSNKMCVNIAGKIRAKTPSAEGAIIQVVPKIKQVQIFFFSEDLD
jgi:hypothetical protein